MKYSYRAVDYHDNVVEGTETANDFQQLLETLYAKRLYPLEVRQLSSTGVKTENHLQHLKKLKGKLAMEDKPVTKPVPSAPVPSVVQRRFHIWDWALVILLVLCFLGVILSGSVPQR